MCYYVLDIFIVPTKNPVSPFEKRPDDFISTLALLLWFDVVARQWQLRRLLTKVVAKFMSY